MHLIQCVPRNMTLINSYECRLLYTVLDIKSFLQFILLEKSFVQKYFTLKSILL